MFLHADSESDLKTKARENTDFIKTLSLPSNPASRFLEYHIIKTLTEYSVMEHEIHQHSQFFL